MVSLGVGERQSLRTGRNAAWQAGSASSAEASTRPENRHETATIERDPHGRVLDRLIWTFLAVTIVALIVALLVAPRPAQAAPAMRETTATWYGPGFYGNAFACTGRHPAVPRRYTMGVRGVAHMTLPCGARLTICRRGVCVRVRVIDRGAFHAGNFDLTARTAMDLCDCWRPYTMTVRWHRGWGRP